MEHHHESSSGLGYNVFGLAKTTRVLSAVLVEIVRFVATAADCKPIATLELNGLLRFTVATLTHNSLVYKHSHNITS